MNPLNPKWLLLIALGVSFIGARNASAQNKAWTSADGAWETPGNWSGGAVPSATDYVNIKNGGTATISTIVPSINRVYVGGPTLSQLSLGSGGSLEVTGNNLIRIGQSDGDKGAITVDGGSLLGANSAIYVGVGNNSQATLTVKNGGTVSAVSNILLATSANTGVTATVNIGGAGTAAAAGWLNVTKLTGGVSAGTAHTNVLNFNHTSTRYLFTKGSGSTDAVLIENNIHVNARQGVTALTGSNTYSGGTTVYDGAVLLANYGTGSATGGATGSGGVEVQAGGALGGTGYVPGNTGISGLLKPGDYDYGAASPSYGLLRFGGNLTLDGASRTVIGIDGTGRGTAYSALNVAGTISLDGTLEIDLWDGFSIANGATATFQLFSGQSAITGGYHAYFLPGMWNGTALLWDTTALSSNGLVSVRAVPEPSTGVLLVGGAFLLLGIRRRLRGAA